MHREGKEDEMNDFTTAAAALALAAAAVVVVLWSVTIRFESVGVPCIIPDKDDRHITSIRQMNPKKKQRR